MCDGGQARSKVFEKRAQKLPEEESGSLLNPTLALRVPTAYEEHLCAELGVMSGSHLCCWLRWALVPLSARHRGMLLCFSSWVLVPPCAPKEARGDL